MPQGGIVTTYSDITERVEAADALARANETLERRVEASAPPSSARSTRRWRRQAKADEANLDKTRFLAAASHDMLQPLNAARLYAIEPRRAAVQIRPTASLRAMSMPRSKRSRRFSARCSTCHGSMPVIWNRSCRPSPVARVVPAARGGVRAAGSRERPGTAQFVGSSLWVRSDRRLMRRVLQNLISNAIKYTRQGRVVVGCRRRGVEVIIHVQRHWAGHSEAPSGGHLQGVPAARGDGIDGSRSRSWAVDRGADRQSARRSDRAPLDARPRLGIHRGAARSPKPGVRSRPVEAAFVSGGAIAGTVVLCIDNERQVLAGMEALLEGWGCRVLAGKGGGEAVDALAGAGEPPQVVLADYHLDDGTGIDAVRKVAFRNRLRGASHHHHGRYICGGSARDPTARSRAAAQANQGRGASRDDAASRSCGRSLPNRMANQFAAIRCHRCG